MTPISLLVFAGLCFLPPGVGPVEFNQRFIERQWSRFNPGYIPSLPEPSHTVPGTDTDMENSNVRFDEPMSVFSYVFASLPDEMIVHPTETYYYFRFQLGPTLVNGNFRLLDAASGIIRFGYFDTYDISLVQQGAVGVAEGLRVEPAGPNAWKAAFRGRTVLFKMESDALRQSPLLSPRDDEQFVSGVLDESGVSFQLIFNTARHCFYYCLNESMPAADRFVPADDDPRFLIGQETRFVLYSDGFSGRSILVGVLADNVRRNNYFDGPFDQVPPRLDLRDMLEAAYPYVKYRGGIDEHGNFCEIEGERVAVSCYQTYERAGSLLTRLKRIADHAADAEGAWELMTYESKRDFHHQIEQIIAAKSSTPPWPANHWGAASRSWGASHKVSISRTWPANHVLKASKEGCFPAE